MVRTRPADVGAAVGSLKSYCMELLTQRSQLDAKIAAVEQALRVMGSPGPRGRPAGRKTIVRRGGRRRGGRGPRAGSLKEHILSVISGGGIMAVKDITDGVLAAGYRTKNKTLAKSVGIALTELPGVKKVARGKFRCK